MKKNLVYGLLLLSTLSVSLNSCRTDEMMTGTEQAQKEKIAFFERFEMERSLSKNAESNNYALPFGNSMLAYFNNYPDKKTELESKYGTVDLKVSSQDIDLENGRKLLMFPMLTDGKVTAVIGGVINAERDYLYFDVYKENHPDRDYLIQAFQQHYNSLSLGRTIDVGEVVIIVKKPELKKPDPWDEDPGGGGHDMNGGSGDYGDGGGGGTNTPNQPANTNPCEQTKNIVNNSKSKPALDSLKKQSKLGGEKGAKFKPDGTPSKLISGDAHSVNFGDKTGYTGAYHNHTPTGIPMLSPPDIEQLLQFALAQGNYGTPSNAFMGMIAPNGMHYVATFNGSYNDALVSFSQTDLTSYTDLMSMRNSLFNPSTPEGYEKLFFQALTDMKLDGKVNLQRIESDGTVKTVTKDNNGIITANPCS